MAPACPGDLDNRRAVPSWSRSPGPGDDESAAVTTFALLRLAHPSPCEMTNVGAIDLAKPTRKCGLRLPHRGGNFDQDHQGRVIRGQPRQRDGTAILQPVAP